MVGYGLPSTIMKVANSLRWMGSAQYQLGAYHSLISNKGYHCDIEFVDARGENQKITGKYVMIQGQTTVHCGNRIAFCPDAKLNDGLIDLVLVKHGTAAKMMKIMTAAKKGKHVQDGNVEVYQVRSFQVRPHDKVKLQGPSSVNIDGELVGMSPFKAVAIPRALRVVAP
mmetsp:Transcript_8314/g.18150  ORF Transcript_8314/g.18150 Transcript_8314/m.18150 type:complete len:169 (-) Transcript_8314:96-602(-)